MHVRLNRDVGREFNTTEIRNDVCTFLTKRYAGVSIGRVESSENDLLARSSLPVIGLTHSNPSAIIERIEIASASNNSKFPDTNSYSLADYELNILTYTLHTGEEGELHSGKSEG